MGIERTKSTRNFIQLLLNGKVYEIKTSSPDITLLEWLREETALTGTKEGCAEGDCGSCTVVVAKQNSIGEIQWRPLNSCISFLPLLDGTSVTTIENISCKNGNLHPCQKIITEYHGSQCGFCTPGIVMSIYSGWLQDIDWCDQNIETLLAGNLCRCTGYASIKRGCKSLKQYAFSEINRSKREQEISEIKKLDVNRDLEIKTNISRWSAPNTLQKLLDCLDSNPKATIISGSTDLGLWITKKRKFIPHFVSIQKIKELRQITDMKTHWEIGAGVSISDTGKILGKEIPDFTEVIRRFGSEQVRSQGTIGGNIANGSPIGDLPPMLLALDAIIVLQSKNGKREVPLRNFFIEYGQQNRARNEVITFIIVPKLNNRSIFRAYKITKRFDQDISSVMAAFLLELKNNLITGLRIAFGGMAGIPARAYNTEKYLLNKKFTLENITHASEKILIDFSPISDVRGSAHYRKITAKNLVKKLWYEIENQQYFRLSGPLKHKIVSDLETHYPNEKSSI